MPPSPASKKRKTETQVVQPVEVFNTDVKGNQNERICFFALKRNRVIQGLILFLSLTKRGHYLRENNRLFNM